jgi:autotransporter family porin
LRTVLSGTTDTEVVIGNGVVVEISSGGVINPSATATKLRGQGGTIDTASDLLGIVDTFRAAHPDPADWGTYFSGTGSGTFAGAVEAAVAAALSTSGASVIQGDGSTTRTAAVILDTRTGTSLSYQGLLFQNFDNALTGYCSSRFCGGGIVGSYDNSDNSAVGTIENSIFYNNRINSSSPFLGGGVVGARSSNYDYGASIGAIANSIFKGNTVTMSGAYNYGGGVVGAASSYDGAIESIATSIFDDNTVTFQHGINGGGVVGVYADNKTVASFGAISSVVFSGNTVTAVDDALRGGGVVGAFAGDNITSANVVAIADSVFSGNIVKVTNSALQGGGVVGAYIDWSYGTASVGAITNSVFSDNTVTTGTYMLGGGIISAVNGYSSGVARLDNLSGTIFRTNTVTTGTYIMGGGVIGLVTENTGTAAASANGIRNSVFSNNTITANNGQILGGVFYSYGLNGGMTIENSAFLDNTFISLINDDTAYDVSGLTPWAKVYGTLVVDTSAPSVDANGHVLTLSATANEVTVFDNNKIIEDGVERSNALYFGALPIMSTFSKPKITATSSQGDAVLNIEAESGGIVALYDPISVEIDNNHTFNMKVNENLGTGDFRWGGANTIDTGAKTGAITLYAGKTTLLNGFGLTASNHTVTVNNNATLYVEGTSTLNVSSVIVAGPTSSSDIGGILEIASTGKFNTAVYEQENGATLDIMVNTSRADAYIVAGSADLAGTLNISGISGSPEKASDIDPTQYLLISTGSISNDFSTFTIGGGTGVDYATVITTKGTNSYTAGLGLTWYSGDSAHGNFTLTNSTDTFTVDVALIDQTGNLGWHDSSLTKKGDGTLILSAANTYTGGTTVSAGALTVTGTLGSGGAYAGDIANNGKLTFDQTADQTLSGIVSGTGSLTKTGSGTLTLSGTNTYAGNTTVSAGTLELTGSLGNDLAYAGGVIVESGGTFDLSGVLKTSGVTVESDAFFNITGTTLNVDGQLNNYGTFDITVPHGELDELDLGNGSTLNNNGTIILNHEGNFITNGGNILKAEKLSGNGQIQMYVDIANKTGDLLVITENGTTATTGTQRLLITNQGFNPTGDEDPHTVVKTNGGSATFTGGLTAGAFQYGVQPCADNGNWWCLGLSGYGPNVANYVEAQRVNAETGFLQLANLGQRVGEHRHLTMEPQSWARTYYHQDSEDGKRRFGHDQDTTGLQIGHEVLVKSTDNGGILRAAVAFDTAYTKADFKDHTGLQRDTGSMKSESHALGGYLTHTTANGAYLDLVGQAATLENKITTKTATTHDKATQKGWRAGLSLEGGIPLWKVDNTWLLEGQAQLSYQHTKYQSFKDNTFKVDAYDADTLRGRVGARLVRELTTAENKPLKLYGLVNVHHDFYKPESVTFVNRSNGVTTRVSERYGKSWGEVGVGIQGWVNKSTSVFGDISYQHGFSSPDKGDAKEGGAVNVGVRFRF